ncbi:hypothetical protein sos41_30850 [Alphaproteobacteria bacterium SO-S41]|nr:hypothetical protein sos41_30850 [Alphaproteobacteria bacterium SO-S41]
MLKTFGARLAAGVATMSLMVFSAEAADLQLKRVMLSSGGVGYFEYQAQVEGWETIEVPVRLDQVDDVLKSAVIFDDEGGSGVIELQGRDSLAEIFRTMPVGPDAFSSPASLYGALQGEEISVTEPVAATGRIVSVVEESATDKNGNSIVHHRMSIMTTDGLVQFILEDARGIKFTNEALDAKVNGALSALANNRQRESRTLKITARGEGTRTLTVGFVIEAPLWKTSYRLVTGPDNKTRMQGWAIIENASGADWKDVELTLVSGNPVTFRQQLYDKYYVARETVPVEVLGRVMPQRDEGAIGGVDKQVGEAGSGAADRAARYESEDASPAPPPPPPAPMVAAPASAPMSTDPANIAANSAETATAVSFTLPNAVSAGSGQSLAVPIVDREVPAERISLYNPGVHAVNPLASIRLTNDTESGLPPGIVTLFDTTNGTTTYVGDAVMGTLPQGEKRMLSFALDQKTKVDQSSASESNLTSAKITKGIIEMQSLTRLTYSYTVKAPSNEDRALVIESPRHQDMELKSPDPSSVELTTNAVRVPFAVKAGETGKLDVVWERTDYQSLALAGLDLSTVLYYAGDERLSEPQRAAFKRVADLKQEIQRIEGEIANAGAERDRLFAEQERIRQNLAAVPEGSDLQRRYLATLAEQEDRLTAIAQRLTELQAELDGAKKALDDYVGTVTL